MLDPNLFNTVLVFPILNLLMGFYKLFLIIKLPAAFGLSIITLTGVVRLIFHPFFKQQMETARKMQQIKPHLDHLSKKHKAEPKKLQEEQAKLYKQAGINPATGCLFMLIQIPIFIALYRTLSVFFLNTHGAATIKAINNALYFDWIKIQNLDLWFFGFNLALTPSKAGPQHWYYYAIPLVTALLQYLQVVTSTPPAAPETQGKKGEKTSTGEDFQKAMNTQMKVIFPLMIGWFSFTLPVGLSLYWNIFSLFSIIQNKRMNPDAKLLDLPPIAPVEEKEEKKEKAEKK
jgi:YidC/Oxa1 family membrane protein insertase